MCTILTMVTKQIHDKTIVSEMFTIYLLSLLSCYYALLYLSVNVNFYLTTIIVKIHNYVN